jgi:predicted permease
MPAVLTALGRLLPVFVQTVLPVFLVAGAGWLLGRRLTLDGRTLGRVLFYLATPSLVFRSLYEMQLDPRAIQHVVLVAVLVMLLTAFLGWLVAYNLERTERAAVTLTSGISNNGNMGLPITLFAFGEPGLALATVYYVASSFLTNTVGSVVASAGRAPIGAALAQIVRVPVLYAAVGGLLLNRFGVTLPTGLFRAVDLVASAAVPLMLILLGVQLRHVNLRQRERGVFRSAAVRLLAAPVLAWGLCLLFGIRGTEGSVIIVQAAMPTAVITSVLATEYDTAPRLVATIILVSTLISMVTLSVILTLVG